MCAREDGLEKKGIYPSDALQERKRTDDKGSGIRGSAEITSSGVGRRRLLGVIPPYDAIM